MRSIGMGAALSGSKEARHDDTQCRYDRLDLEKGRTFLMWFHFSRRLAGLVMLSIRKFMIALVNRQRQ
jgi:hypothetical protein